MEVTTKAWLESASPSHFSGWSKVVVGKSVMARFKLVSEIVYYLGCLVMLIEPMHILNIYQLRLLREGIDLFVICPDCLRQVS